MPICSDSTHGLIVKAFGLPFNIAKAITFRVNNFSDSSPPVTLFRVQPHHTRCRLEISLEDCPLYWAFVMATFHNRAIG